MDKGIQREWGGQCSWFLCVVLTKRKRNASRGRGAKLATSFFYLYCVGNTHTHTRCTFSPTETHSNWIRSMEMDSAGLIFLCARIKLEVRSLLVGLPRLTPAALNVNTKPRVLISTERPRRLTDADGGKKQRHRVERWRRGEGQTCVRTGRGRRRKSGMPRGSGDLG